jgi:hypothetical protein
MFFLFGPWLLCFKYSVPTGRASLFFFFYRHYVPSGTIFSRPCRMHNGPIGTLMFVKIERYANPVPIGTICFFYSGRGCWVSNIPSRRDGFSLFFFFYRHYVPSGTNIFDALPDGFYFATDITSRQDGFLYFATDIMSLAGPIFSRLYGMHNGPIGTWMFVEIERHGNPVR